MRTGIVGLFFCALNQMLQTVNKIGRIPEPSFGPEFNVNDRNSWGQRPCLNIMYDCLYALSYYPCAMGYAMQPAGMPF